LFAPTLGSVRISGVLAHWASFQRTSRRPVPFDCAAWPARGFSRPCWVNGRCFLSLFARPCLLPGFALRDALASCCASVRRSELCCVCAAWITATRCCARMRKTSASFGDWPLCGWSLAVAGRAFPSLPILSVAEAGTSGSHFGAVLCLTCRHVGLVRFSGSFTLNKLECLKQAFTASEYFCME